MYTVVSNTLLFFLLLVTLYPLLNVLSSSFSDPKAIGAGRVAIFPVDFSLDGYRELSRYTPIWVGYKNSIMYTIVGTFVNVTLTIMAAYPLSRKDFRGRGLFIVFFAFTMYFSGGMIPSYMLIRNLNLFNNFWVMVLPGALSVYNVIITRTYFQSNIPDSFLEAARLDGCTDVKFLTQVAIPLSTPIIAVNFLFYAVGHWNAFFDAMLYLSDTKMKPLQVVLRDILIESRISADFNFDSKYAEAKQSIAEILKYSTIVASTLPVMLMYPFVQKYFIKGIMLGGLKG
ncbi:MAG: carbohydrate ABC transporter permease [Eubacteriales bacterium]|nr:carbohydrate ABC transporter permease [Eubacteriales bacterium]MDD4709628.1 carbohydrate ABC transporter permease [Eubacteriales bacterium]